MATDGAPGSFTFITFPHWTLPSKEATRLLMTSPQVRVVGENPDILCILCSAVQSLQS